MTKQQIRVAVTGYTAVQRGLLPVSEAGRMLDRAGVPFAVQCRLLLAALGCSRGLKMRTRYLPPGSMRRQRLIGRIEGVAVTGVLIVLLGLGLLAAEPTELSAGVREAVEFQAMVRPVWGSIQVIEAGVLRTDR